ncbi:MAG: type II toxin-antitoxin system VapC family toxin [Bacillati bacterium ANGP1]|uniref:Type II toxin-antitoxin system VapC family toxin n=1 Tax=Candidatus Segetimicrobium genomatis TaxID=2569760 RepID=A0A537K3P3_9BACT|nr:MAG: type II toxin-antitoxin system VapC family toxin [Terrabacteria group bacterium ANGP1]
MSGPIYWDSSAVLSALLQDQHSKDAVVRSHNDGLHLLSSLTWAETHAVLARIERERMLTQVLVRAAREALDTGPWRRVTISPEWKRMRTLASRWPLRGADLWHLAAAMSLKDDLPELSLLSYDARLAAAAEGEGLTP